MHRILLTLCAFCFVNLPAHAQLFRSETPDVSVTVERARAVELTQDEWVDYFIYGTDPSGNVGFWIYENQGNGTFGLRPVSVAPLSEATFAFADFDLDNQLDLLLSGIGADGPITEVYYNQSGTFTGPATPIDRSLAHSLTDADFDQDGRIDVFLNGTTTTDSAVSRAYRNTDAGFLEIRTPMAATATGTNVAYDWDNDGRPDLLQTGRLPNGETVTHLYRNRGGFAFDSLAVGVGLPSVSATALATGDVNHDGRADLLISGVDAQNRPLTGLYVFQDSVYVERAANLPSVAGKLATLADFNHDGLTDVGIIGATAAGQPVARWHLQTDAIWTMLSYDSLAASNVCWATGDVDNDGHLDMLRSGFANEPSLLLLNQTVGINDGPAAPVNPTVSAIDTVTVFGWEPTADDQTDALTLTYELYVVAQGEAKFAVSPEYRDTTKARVDHGRIGYPTQYAVNGLPEGTYEWSVAAVDNSFQIGPSCEGDGGRPLCFTIARDDTTLCAGTTLRLRTAEPVAWNSTLSGSLGLKAELTHVVQDDEVLYYTAQSTTDCALAYSLRIQTIPAPTDDLLTSDTTVCPGASLSLAVDTTYAAVTWFSAAQGVLGTANRLDWEATREDTLWVEARLPGEDCAVRDTMTVAWFPPVNLLSEEVEELVAGASISLSATGAESYRWSPAAGLSSTEVADPLASPSKTTTYTVEGTTANGCVVLDTILIRVTESPPPAATLFVPNLFSPNGDGQNDTFRLYGPVSSIIWQVYDRQGNRLFEADDIAAGWNGEHQGRPVPNGVYLWKISGKLADGTPLQFEGQQSGMLRLVR